ncbi:MAG TPA: hypothetical protein ENI26_02105 [Methylophaga aminisulfidivorans]|nr:hypothetical protein [Methylophaga aminisulfidivorans]
MVDYADMKLNDGRFNPTKENLEELSKSLRVQDAEILLHHVLKRASHEYCTKYEVFINCEGINSSLTTTGPDYLKAASISMRNLRGEFIGE